MALEFTTSYLTDALSVFRAYKKLGDGAMAQVTDDEFARVLDGEMNSIALIVKHMAGNMRSRWTDFLTTDGEKPDRAREAEFADPPATRAAVLGLWEAGWQLVFAALEPLSDADLGREVRIRGERHSVMQAINRAAHPLRVSRRANRATRETLPGSGVAVPEHSAWRVSAVRGPGSRRRGEPALATSLLRPAFLRPAAGDPSRAIWAAVLIAHGPLPIITG